MLVLVVADVGAESCVAVLLVVLVVVVPQRWVPKLFCWWCWWSWGL